MLPMKLTIETMQDRFYASDREYDGRFITGVVTTGIYCLPSCTARKPRVENIRFFDTEDAAVAAGLRPCRRCRPDAYYRGDDQDLDRVTSLAGAIRKDPAGFADTSALASAAGVGPTKLTALFRDHYHTTPAAFLTRERIGRARSLLREGSQGGAEAGLDAGFESVSAFHENFRRYCGMTPGEYQRLQGASSFRIDLPNDYRTAEVLRFGGRDVQSRTESLCEDGFTKVVWIDETPVRLTFHFEAEGVMCVLDSQSLLPADAAFAAHAVALRMLGLTGDPAPFERRAIREPIIARLIEGHEGLRIPLTHNVFEGLVWAIVGQQVNLTFAATLRRALNELCGHDAGNGFLATPRPEDVAGLNISDLTARQFSGRKAEYLIGISQLVASGELPLEAMPDMPATTVNKALLAVRGLGPWAVNYLMLRACGFADCVPLGDTGLTSGLQRLYELTDRPDAKNTPALMEPFAPHRSLATAHLWAG